MNPPALAIGTDQALAFRLGRQHLLSFAPGGLEAARTLLGAQAQVLSAAVLQLRARSRDVTAEWTERAIQRDRSLVRLWGHRSTLHLAAAPDLALLTAVRRHAEPGYLRWLTGEGLTAEQAEALVVAIGEAVVERPLSRAELAAALVPRLGEWARPWLLGSWGGAIKFACARGLVCHAGGDGEDERSIRFARLDRWVALGDRPDPAAALAELLRRYLAAFGPAGPRDFAKFTGLPAEPLRAAFAAVAGELLPVSVDGGPAFVLAADEAALREAAMPSGHIAVLPLFDPWLLAHAGTAEALPPERRPQVFRTAGWISPVVLRHGRVVATWSHRRGARGWSVTVDPWRRLGKGDRARIERGLRHLAKGQGAAEVAVAYPD
ncbi:MAG TPA: winged helix DNA-binding domain-containing protein [Alphaproteobacteria bacterium]|nr:winged helix DNA-binding domain-containing protein [Alphaproteobacteria bacterium]